MEDPSSSAIPDGEIVGIQFGLASHREISTASVSGSSISHASQLSNPYLGLPLEFGKCESCGSSDPGNCEGHFGYIELPIAVYHPSHVSELKRLLTLVCLKCLKLKNNKFPNKSTGIVEQLLASCCEDASQVSIGEVKRDGYCYLQLKVPSKRKLKQGFWNFLERYGFRYGGFPGEELSKRTLLPCEVMEMLKRIPEETRKRLKGKGFFPQDGYILQYLPVPPNCLSVPDVSDGVTVMSTDPSTTMLKKILRQIEIIRSSRSLPNFESLEVESNELQLAVDQYLQVRGTVKNRDLESRLGVKKEDNNSSRKVWLEKMRTLFIRKGSGFSSRSVITGDAYKAVNEVGVPQEIAQRITFEERVTQYNMRYLQELVDNKLCLTYRDGLSTYSLREGSKGHTFLKPGQIVHRRIMDGDIVFINRPPTTHKHSLQALKVYVHDDHTVKINPLICGPLSADFDGDCIHLFYPQSPAAKAEVLELFALEKQILSSHSGNLIMQLASDSLLSLKMLFKRFFMDKVEVQQLAMFTSLALPQPALWLAHSSDRAWTALQVLQTALPPSFSCSSERFLIKGSEIMVLDCNKEVTSSIINEIGTSICFEKGSAEVLRFFNTLQPLLMENIFTHGFSVGLEDFSISQELVKTIHKDIQDISQLLFQLRSTYNELVELQMENHIRLAKVPVTRFILRSSSMGGLIDSKSESSIDRIVQQIGFLGLQISDRGKFYSKTLVEDISVLYKGKYPENMDYPSAEYGLIKSCFFHGLDPYEEIVHSISTREVIVRSSRGLSEPGTLFKNLMAILRDVVICYDGTVRNVCSNSIIQFEYGDKRTRSIYPPGEPVGVLAATAMSNPAYKAVLDSTPSSNSSWEFMKEILLCKANFNNELIDRRVILYLNYCGCGREYCREKAAYLIKNQLKKVSLKDTASQFLIEYRENNSVLGDFEINAGLVGHIHLNKELLRDKDISMNDILQKCEETINSFRRKKKVGGHLKKAVLSINENCSFHKSGSDGTHEVPCLLISLRQDVIVSLEVASQILADSICPYLLETIIKGDTRICSANITWTGPDSPSWIRNPQDSESGELAVDVVLDKSAVKQSGDAWRIVLDSCLPVLHLIDTRRSIPYGIKQVEELLGISAVFDQAVQRLSTSVSMVSKGVLKEHLILLANSMSCAGKFIGFNAGGYKALSKSLNIQVPFTEATLITPKKCFERAAEKCHVDSLNSIVASCSWGKHVAVGTGSRFDILWDTRKVELNPKGGVEVHNFLHMVSPAGGEVTIPGSLGVDIDDIVMEDNADLCQSPENFGSDKPVFEDVNEFMNISDKDLPGESGWESLKSGSGSGKEWGVEKNVTHESNDWSDWAKPNKDETQTQYETSGAGGWGSKADDNKPGNAEGGWDRNGDDTQNLFSSKSQEPSKSSDGWDAAPAWGQNNSKNVSSDVEWGKDDSQGGGWGSNDSKNLFSSKSSDSFKASDGANTASAWGTKGSSKNLSSGSGWGTADSGGGSRSKDRQNVFSQSQETSNDWGATASAWGEKSSAENVSSVAGWGRADSAGDFGSKDKQEFISQSQEPSKAFDEASAWGAKSSTENVPSGTGWGNADSESGGPRSEDTQSKSLSNDWDNKVASKKEASAWESNAEGWNKDGNSSQPVEPADSPGANSSWGTPISQGSAQAADGWQSPRVGDGNNGNRWERRGSFKKNESSGGWGQDNWKLKKNRQDRFSGANSDIAPVRLYTETRQRLDVFTSEEQEVLSLIEPIMKSLRRIMHKPDYSDGDPLPPEDQEYIIENVFNYHPEKDAKMGSGIDHFMVNKHGTFQESRCLYVVSTDGRKEDFSYRKCLDNLLKSKFPDVAAEFLGKYFRKPRPREPISTPEQISTPEPNSTPVPSEIEEKQ